MENYKLCRMVFCKVFFCQINERRNNYFIHNFLDLKLVSCYVFYFENEKRFSHIKSEIPCSVSSQ